MPDFPSPYAPVETFIPVSNSGYVGRHKAVTLSDNVDVTVRLEFTMPNNFKKLVSAYIELVAKGTGNLRRSVFAEWGKSGSENYNVNSDSIPAGEVAVTTDKLELINVLSALDGVREGDTVGLEFTRHGSHGNDTIGALCFLLGIRLKIKVK